MCQNAACRVCHFGVSNCSSRRVALANMACRVFNTYFSISRSSTVKMRQEKGGIFACSRSL